MLSRCGCGRGFDSRRLHFCLSEPLRGSLCSCWRGPQPFGADDQANKYSFQLGVRLTFRCELPSAFMT
jgi:hypothetical protein